MRRQVVLALAVLAACPAAASAGTVELVNYGAENIPKVTTPDRYALVFRPDAGEANRLTVEAEDVYATAIVRDEGSPLRPGNGCREEGDHVRCDFDGQLNQVEADLGDGDDEIRVLAQSPTRTRLQGGPGNDLLLSEGWATLDGGPGADRMDSLTVTASTVDYGSRTAPVSVTVGAGADDGEPGEGDDVGPGIDAVQGGAGDDALFAPPGGKGLLFGGPGRDLLTGGEERDTLDGGPGDDRLDARGGDDVLLAEPGADVIRGGAGNDSLEYRFRTAPVRVTLDDRPGDGEAGENDDAGSDIEQLTGGQGNDVLEAFAGTQKLTGGPGADRVLGGEGADNLFEASTGGRDTLVPGPGGDHVQFYGDVRVEAADGEPDLINCGGYGGEIVADSRVDGLPGCNVLAVIRGAPLRATRAGRVTAFAGCASLIQACSGTVQIRRGRRILATRTVFLRAGEPSRVTLKLRSAARRMLRSRRRMRVTIVAALARPGLPETGHTAQARATLNRGRLKRRGR